MGETFRAPKPGALAAILNSEEGLKGVVGIHGPGRGYKGHVGFRFRVRRALSRMKSLQRMRRVPKQIRHDSAKHVMVKC